MNFILVYRTWYKMIQILYQPVQIKDVVILSEYIFFISHFCPIKIIPIFVFIVLKKKRINILGRIIFYSILRHTSNMKMLLRSIVYLLVAIGGIPSRSHSYSLTTNSSEFVPVERKLNESIWEQNTGKNHIWIFYRFYAFSSVKYSLNNFFFHKLNSAFGDIWISAKKKGYR